MSQLSMFSNSPVKATSIIGTRVFNPKGHDLGVIKDMVIDPSSGKVAYVVVNFVHSFVMGDKLFAIPLSSFEYNVTKNEYVLNVAKERFENAPGFDSDRWPSMADEKWHREVHTFYKSTPWWER